MPRGGRVFAQQIRQGRERWSGESRYKSGEHLLMCESALIKASEGGAWIYGPRSDTTLPLSQGRARAIKLLLPLAEAHLYCIPI